MATDFTVIVPQRQHFGDEQGAFSDVPNKIVGPKKDFTFNCPSVNPNETALLIFQSRGVDHERNIVRVNKVDISGGLPQVSNGDTWNGNILLIGSQHKLTATNNVLHIESRNDNGQTGGDIDDFIIDNVVIVFKTR